MGDIHTFICMRLLCFHTGIDHTYHIRDLAGAGVDLFCDLFHIRSGQFQLLCGIVYLRNQMLVVCDHPVGSVSQIRKFIFAGSLHLYGQVAVFHFPERLADLLHIPLYAVSNEQTEYPGNDTGKKNKTDRYRFDRFGL